MTILSNQNGSKNDREELVKVYETTNYDQFKFLNENRKIESTHVERLIASIQTHNKLKQEPIEVTENLEVTDGQHRLMAAKRLGIPIYYKFDHDFKIRDIALSNSIRLNWTLANYLDFYSSQGYDDYIQLKKFSSDMGVTLIVSLDWLAKNPNIAKASFKAGSYKFEVNSDVLDAMLATRKLIAIMKEERMVRPQNMFGRLNFHRACRKFFTNPLVDINKFFDRVSRCPHAIYVSSLEGYVTQLVQIYNFDSRSEKTRINIRKEGDKLDIV